MNMIGVGNPGRSRSRGFVANIVIATLGNIVGGVAVGTAYWFAYRTRENRA